MAHQGSNDSVPLPQGRDLHAVATTRVHSHPGNEVAAEVAQVRGQRVNAVLDLLKQVSDRFVVEGCGDREGVMAHDTDRR